MFRLQSSKFLMFTIAAAAFVSQAAFATSIDFSGALTESDPVFNRPFTTGSLSIVGTHTAYDVYGFHVSADGTYSIEATAFTGPISDSFVALYQNAFISASPLSNLLQVDDDSGVGRLSLLNSSLTAGVQYYLIFTSYFNDEYGTYTGRFTTVSGGGQVFLDSATVPEPGSLALFGLGVVGFVASRRKSAKSKNA
jgi:hypothetical protein